MPKTNRSWIIFLVGAGLTLIAAGLSPLLMAYAQDTTPEATPEVGPGVVPDEELTPEAGEATPESIYRVSEMPPVSGDNSYCMICHNQAWHTVTLDDGTIQNLYVDPDTIAASVHGSDSSEGTFGCIDCHGADAFPHNNPSPADERAYTLYSVSICASCHVEEVHELDIGLHEEAIRAGNREAAVCTDCHGAHDVQPIVEQPDLIAGVCGECHENTLVEWQSSAHVNIEPLGCATCHSQHSQRLRAGNTADEMCINCHKDVSNVFVHNQHLTPDSDVTCVSCHMYRGEPIDGDGETLPVSTLPESTGHSMLMDATPCTTCHEQLVVSGEWDELVASRELVESLPQAEVVEAPAETELVQAVQTSEETSYVPLLQGLILGLGFGVTFAAVFITRGNRTSAAAAHTEAPSPAEPIAAETPAAETEITIESEDSESESSEDTEQ